ncbi:hypothetical protein [Pelagicoccus mobilis]|uniref:TonB C-terminal domain-containing protein n=1 Tax=Pelagicoccus mobilis TaxID=415221 RepID=A0A934RQB1_9BACT|nr:hypothetical protein [Pelagicoccus mobilis]MBK1875545.1 hypothetical protein [Pelagicoccus mobilis]
MKYFAWKFVGGWSLLLSVVAALAGSGSLWGQAQVLVEYDGEMLPVVSMDGATPEVIVNRQRVKVSDGRLRVESAAAFTDGAIEVLSRRALMGQDYGSAIGGFFFRFEAMVEAERDFEDCFVLFVVSPEKGDPSYIIREIPDINKTGSERIAVTLPVNPGFGGGKFAYRVFSKGEEILRREADDPISVAKMGETSGGAQPMASGFRRSRPAADAAVGEPAKVVKERLLSFPEELLGRVSGGYATAVYSIDERGKVMELLDLKLDNAAFAPEILKTLLGTKYKAGRYDGKPLVTTVKQSFFFNEFAPFAEAMEMVPYPKIADRDAVSLYAPVPEIAVEGVSEVKLEVVVNELGLVKQSGVLEAADESVGQAVNQKAKSWVFLPAVVDGYPAEQRLEVPVAVGIKE